MTDDDAHDALEALKAAWPRQGMSDAERTLWTRQMRWWTFDEFDRALTTAIDQGGSQQASRPGFRPTAAEFASIVRATRNASVRERQQSELSERLEDDPRDPFVSKSGYFRALMEGAK